MYTPTCKMQDDEYDVCNKSMTRTEYKQDGMCSSCADLLWDSIQNNTKFIRNKDESRRHTSGRQPL